MWKYFGNMLLFSSKKKVVEVNLALLGDRILDRTPVKLLMQESVSPLILIPTPEVHSSLYGPQN